MMYIRHFADLYIYTHTHIKCHIHIYLAMHFKTNIFQYASAETKLIGYHMAENSEFQCLV